MLRSSLWDPSTSVRLSTSHTVCVHTFRACAARFFGDRPHRPLPTAHRASAGAENTVLWDVNFYECVHGTGYSYSSRKIRILSQASRISGYIRVGKGLRRHRRQPLLRHTHDRPHSPNTRLGATWWSWPHTRARGPPPTAPQPHAQPYNMRMRMRTQSPHLPSARVPKSSPPSPLHLSFARPTPLCCCPASIDF